MKSFVNKFCRNKLRIGIDIDGTLTEHIPFFRKLTRSNAFEVYIITARGNELAVRNWTENWLKNKGIRYKELIMAENKAKICLEKDIVLMFENDIDELSMLHEAEVKVACLPDGTWRPGEITPTPTRVRDWWNVVFKLSNNYFSKSVNNAITNNPIADAVDKFTNKK